MTDVALIDHQSRCERAWGVIVGEHFYRADVLVLPLANQEPPALMTFTLRPIPEFPDRLPNGAAGPVGPPPTLVDWFMVGASGHVALQACELVSAKLTEITEAEFTAMEDAHRPAAPVDPTLSAADFAGPNRAQRRAQENRPKRRRR